MNSHLYKPKVILMYTATDTVDTKLKNPCNMDESFRRRKGVHEKGMCIQDLRISIWGDISVSKVLTLWA